mgnify:CR=1 FL=1
MDCESDGDCFFHCIANALNEKDMHTENILDYDYCLKDINDKIIFNNIYFSYEKDIHILNNINFNISNKSYNAIIFNTESILRNREYLIPKICLAAINAYKFNTITAFGNLNVSREWNWCEEQVKYLLRFINKEPQDFILSNGKAYTAKQMIYYAFNYFNLDYKRFIKFRKSFLRKKDFKIKRSNYSFCLKRNNIRRQNKIYGKRIVYALIKYYLNETKN